MKEKFEVFTTAVTRAYKQIQQIKKHESVTFGLKGIHVMCMVALGKNDGGLTITELASRCCEDKAAVSRTVDSLVEKGYATYEATGARRRWRSKVRLTREGRRVSEDMDRLIEEIVCEISEGLPVEQVAVFYKTFAIINSRLERYCKTLGRGRGDSQRNSKEMN